MIKRCLLSVVLGLGACTAPPGEPDSTLRADATPAGEIAKTVPTGQLPASVVPRAYTLDLSIVPERNNFSGHVTIDIDIRERLDHFYLHASQLRIQESLLRTGAGEVLQVKFRETDVEGVAEIVLPRSLSPGQASLEIRYEGPFGERLKGLYRVLDGGQAYAYTQFQPISAREAFPAFDEPRFKTPFTVSLSVEQDHVAIANTPQVERIPLENGLTRYRFATTPPLPTYLVAFAVGPLDVVEAPAIPVTPQRKVPLPLRGVATAGKGDRLGHALGTTPDLLTLFEAYFDLAHPYPKIDILAVPEFAAGAMENVGAITYRESLLLLADDAPVLQRRRHALVHAHEIAHMWFGNLVTMPWWDDVWLSEAFATWMAYKIVAAWNPEHKAGLSRLGRLNNAMIEDSLSTARQIRQPVRSNHDIENAFDGITYSKGGAVLTMFERYMGEENFRTAIRQHIEKFAHGNADVDDFIESIANVGGQAVGDAMGSFLFQPGIPLLDVALDCTASDPVVTIRQSRFRPLGSEAADSRGWTVPVCLRYGDENENHEDCHLVGPAITTLPLDMTQCPAWLLPNAGFAGYFHWLMAPSAYSGLMAAEGYLSAIEQMSVADSIYAGLATGRLSVGEGATLLATLAYSERPQVAMIPRQFIEHTRDYLVAHTSTHQGLVDYTKNLYAELPGERVFDPDYMSGLRSDSWRLFMVEAAELLAWAGDIAVVDRAVEAAQHWIDGRVDQVAPSSLGLALRLAARERGEVVLNDMLQRLKQSRDGQERKLILAALAQVTDPARTPEIRALALGKDIRINEIRGFLTDHMKEPENHAAAWAWLQEHFDALLGRLPPRDAGRLPADMAARFCEETLIPELKSFLAPHMDKLVGGPRNLAKALERIELCSRRAAIQRPQAANFF